MRRTNPLRLSEVLNAWLNTHATALPQSLGLDGKMLRNHFGVISMARHADGDPEAMALYDHEEGPGRCEQSAPQQMVQSIPAPDGKVITADALHRQGTRSRQIVEKGGTTTQESRFYVSSLGAQGRTDPQWMELILGHWAGVENRNHWRRDALFGEDRSPEPQPNPPGQIGPDPNVVAPKPLRRSRHA